MEELFTPPQAAALVPHPCPKRGFTWGSAAAPSVPHTQFLAAGRKQLPWTLLYSPVSMVCRHHFVWIESIPRGLQMPPQSSPHGAIPKSGRPRLARSGHLPPAP